MLAAYEMASRLVACVVVSVGRRAVPRIVMEPDRLAPWPVVAAVAQAAEADFASEPTEAVGLDRVELGSAAGHLADFAAPSYPVSKEPLSAKDLSVSARSCSRSF